MTSARSRRGSWARWFGRSRPSWDKQRTLTIVAEVIRELARQSGAELAQFVGEQTLDAFARTLDRWCENGALEIDVLEQSPEKLSFNVTRCRYAEMYRALGLADLGGSLSCQRDFALAQGFNSTIHLDRTQTIMEGASHCDFRFQLRSEAGQQVNENHAVGPREQAVGEQS